MTGGKSLKVNKFARRNNFSLWQIKIRVLLKPQGLWTPLLKPASNPLPANIATEEKASGMWCKLESLYMTKSLTFKLLLKQRLLKSAYAGRYVLERTSRSIEFNIIRFL